MAEKESIDIVLSATDNATAVIKKSAGEMALLQDKIEQTAKSTARGTDSIQKFANVLGAGWITDSAAQLKELSEAGKGAMESLKGAGTGAMALRAGLVGLAAIGGYKVGEAIASWVFQTKRFTDELSAAVAKAQELQTIVPAKQLAGLNQDLADIDKFGKTMGGMDEAAMRDRLKKEMEGNDRRVRSATRWLEIMKAGRNLRLEPQESVDAAEAKLKTAKEVKKTYDEIWKSRFSEAAVSRREWIAKELEAIKTKEESEKQALDNRKKLTEAFFKFQEDMAKQYAKEEEKQQKAKEKATLRQKDLEIKAASEAIKATQKEISDLEQIKIDTNTSLQGREERVLSRSTDAGGLPAQQLALSKKQTAIAERQEKLDQQIEKHLKLIAEKERDATVELLP